MSVIPNEAHVDSEKSIPLRLPEGVASLSALLSSDPDLQVYRSFNTLASRNLICMQSELFDLEARLDFLDKEDQQLIARKKDGYGDVLHSAKSWQFCLDRQENDEHARERVKIMKEIRILLAEYQDALIRQSRLAALEPPIHRVRTGLAAWFDQERPLTVPDGELFNKYSDLIALRSPRDQDRLTNFLQTHLGKVLRDKHRHDHSSAEEGPAISFYKEGHARHIVSAVSALIAAFLLIGAMVALYYVEKGGVKLGLVAVFTILFAASVGGLTNSRRQDVYASTAAYAAVLVVFISGNIQGA